MSQILHQKFHGKKKHEVINRYEYSFIYFSNQSFFQGPSMTYPFQTETAQLLNLVAHSLYTEKEVSFD
jgi:hypothetical protein